MREYTTEEKIELCYTRARYKLLKLEGELADSLKTSREIAENIEEIRRLMEVLNNDKQ